MRHLARERTFTFLTVRRKQNVQSKLLIWLLLFIVNHQLFRYELEKYLYQLVLEFQYFSLVCHCCYVHSLSYLNVFLL